ncbi:MAG: hypothetical protein KTR31_31040 [Myxococcales bacterium]|nr:hypothetical protein [Myxococcales bacterium]
MDNATLLQQLRKPPSEARAHWHRAMRLVMSLRSEGLQVDWSSADLSVDDQPVDAAEWQAWLRTEPQHVSMMISLLPLQPRRPGIPSYAEVMDFVVREVPGLVHRLLRPRSNPERRAIDDALGAPLGRACDGLGMVAADWNGLGDEVAAGWLEGRLRRPERMNPYHLQVLGERKEQLHGSLAAIYPALALHAFEHARDDDHRWLKPRTDWLRATTLARMLETQRDHPEALDPVMRLFAEQGTSAGLQALAEVLPDAALGTHALFWLACAGARGLAAAQDRWRDGSSEAEGHMQQLSRLPHGASIPSGPRFRLPSDLGAWIPAEEPLPTDASTPALTRAQMCAMAAGWDSPAASEDSLDAAQWADYLQVTSLDDHLLHVGPSWDEARQAGWLGRGADWRFLLAAARRLAPNGRRHWHRSSEIRWGHLFLWAGADRDTYVAAMSSTLRDEDLRRTAGWITEHWLDPLQQCDPSWRDQIEEWVDRARAPRPMLGPVEARPVGSPVTWRADDHALVGTVPATGSARLTLGGQHVRIVPSIGRLELRGIVAGTRSFPPTEEALQIHVTRTNDGVRFGFGSVTWGEVRTADPECTAEGLVDVVLRREVQTSWWAVQQLIGGNPEGAAWLAAQGDEEAARLLGVVAALRPSVQRTAVDAALAELGDAAAETRRALGRAPHTLALPLRSVAAVEAALVELMGGALIRQDDWVWMQDHGIRQGGFEGPALHFGRGAQPPVDGRLIELCAFCPLYPVAADPMDVERREVLGVHQLRWRLVPQSTMLEDGPLFYVLLAMLWPVEGGWALALWSSHDVATPHALLGVPFLPPGGWTQLHAPDA